MRAYQRLSAATLEWAARQVGRGAKVMISQRLTGGISSDVDRLVVRYAGRERSVVLERWGAGDVSLVAREAEALQAAERFGLQAPRLIAVDPTGARAATRCLLMTTVSGKVELAPPDLSAWLGDLAAAHTQIHAVPPVLSTRHNGLMNPDTPARWIIDPGLRREALDVARSPGGEIGFVHGDYQPFNALWEAGRLSGIVDWSLGGTGPIGCDVGHCRLNLAVLFSAEVADEYLHRYTAIAGPVDPRADVRGLLTFGPDWQDFIPLQVAGRATVDRAGMTRAGIASRVTQTVQAALGRVG